MNIILGILGVLAALSLIAFFLVAAYKENKRNKADIEALHEFYDSQREFNRRDAIASMANPSFDHSRYL